MRNATVVVPFLLSASLATSAHAEESESSFMLGLGVSSEESIYKGVGTETNVIPFFAYEKGNFYLHGPTAGYNFVDTDRLKVGALANYRMNGYDASDSVDLAGMTDREGALELGVTASYETDYGELSATALSDVSNEHEGYELELGWEKRIHLSQNWSLSPEASITYRSDDMNTYYYGVTATEATAQRSAYTADADTIYEIGINAHYMIDKQQGIRVGASYQQFGDEISNSSIVEDDSSYEVSAMYIYRF